MTLRMSDDQAAMLDAVARADEVSISEAIRTAIDRHIAERRADPEFQTRLALMVEESQRAADLLAE